MDISAFLDDESRWQAVRTRNTNADGHFCYGVRSTRIYCRPACKARLARRANVSFYEDATAAQAAGFRACKRCKPDVAGLMPEEKAVRRIREFVIAGSTMSQVGDVAAVTDGSGETGQRMSLARMAKEVGLSKWHFHRVFKQCIGVTPVEYVRMMRQNRPLDLGILNTAILDLGGQGDFSVMGDAGVDLGVPCEEDHEALTGMDSSNGSTLGANDPLDDILNWPDDWWNTPLG